MRMLMGMEVCENMRMYEKGQETKQGLTHLIPEDV